MVKYRFKTKKEFIEEFGEDWRRVRCHFVSEMDGFLGQEIEDHLLPKVLLSNVKLEDLYDKEDEDEDYFSYKHYNVSFKMIKRVGVNYNQKKVLVYD